MNTQSASLTGLVNTPTRIVRNPGAYVVGKGTTQRIKDFFEGRSFGYTSSAVAECLNLPSRQLSKRLAELVKAGYLVKEGKEFFHKDNRHL